FQAATGQLDNNRRLRTVKRDIARIYTVMRERELGIRATPAPAPVTEAKPKRARAKKADDATTTDNAPETADAAAESEETK
ncbi:MAG: 50S ribosomal protein L29, partial [Actinomycetota bacterium]|nr:50S ribosomal protein L29 [Actinomycetota bacterium]